MNPRLLAPLLLLFIAQPEQRYFRYERPITGIQTQPKQTCVALDVTAFAHASADLADLRLYRDAQETPYALRIVAPTATEQSHIEPLNLGSRNSNVVFDAEMPEGNYSTVELDLQGRDFIATVDVSGSQAQDGSSATELGSYTVFDLTNQKLGRSMLLHLPVSDFRYLHFKIGSPVRREDVAGLSVEREPLEPAQYLTLAESSQILQQGRSSVVEFTVPANVPVERIEFVLANGASNFSRGVSIAVTPTPGRKTSEQGTRFDGEIRRVHGMHTGRRIDDEQLAIEIGKSVSQASSTWTVTIDNGDDVPLALKAVRLQMARRNLCFNAAPGGNYSLYYGDAALHAPHYDYASLFQPDKEAAEATLGAEQVNARFVPRPDERPFTERHPALLWVALVCVVAVLGGVALRTAKQMRP